MPVNDEVVTTSDERPRRATGFAAMNPEERREAARRGGISAHKSNRAHQFTREEAQAAGAKGGAIVSADREHMAMIGRRGAEKRNAALHAKR